MGCTPLVKVHFAREEEIYLPLLDSKLWLSDAREMFAALEKAAAEAKDRARSLALNDPVFLRFK